MVEERSLFSKLQKFSSKKPASWICSGLSGLSFTMSNFLVQVTIGISIDKKRQISIQQIVFFRCLVQFLFTIVVLAIIRAPLLKRGRDVIYAIPLGITGYMSVIILYLAFERIPLSDALLITFTSPFFCAIFSFCFLRERIHKFDVICALVSFVGVTLVARPSFIFGESINTEKQPLYQNTNTAPSEKEKVYLLGTFFALLGAMFLALYFVFTRISSNRMDLNPTLAVFYPSLMGCFCSPISMFIAGENFIIPSTFEEFFMSLSVGVYSTIALCFLSFSLKHENATIVNLIRNLDVIYAFILQYLVFSISPNVWNITGGFVISIATAAVVLRQWWSWKRTDEDIVDDNIE